MPPPRLEPSVHSVSRRTSAPRSASTALGWSRSGGSEARRRTSTSPRRGRAEAAARPSSLEDRGRRVGCRDALGPGQGSDARGCRDRPRPISGCRVVRSSQPAQTSSTTAMRRCAGVPARRVIDGWPPGEQSQSSAVRRACRYRAATIRVPDGARVRHPACPRCGERLCYRETAEGALFLHADDPAFRLRFVDEIP
jgi:hypothetical protein